jgi:hypothetical protein
MAKLYVTINLTKRENSGLDSQWVATDWIIPAWWQTQQWTSQHSIF